MTNQGRMTERPSLDPPLPRSTEMSSLVRLNRGRKVLEVGKRLAANLFCIRFTCNGLHLHVSIARQLRDQKGPNCIFMIVARHLFFLLYLVTTLTKISACKPSEKFFGLLGSSSIVNSPFSH